MAGSGSDSDSSDTSSGRSSKSKSVSSPKLTRFDGDPASWIAWSAAAKAFLRRSGRGGCLDPKPKKVSEATLRNNLIEGDEDSVRYKFKFDSSGGAAAVEFTPDSEKRLKKDVAKRMKAQKRVRKNWTDSQEDIFDEFLLVLDDRALKVWNTCKQKTGFDAWVLLTTEYGKAMEGDRTLFQRRLAAGEIAPGQKGMLPGDSFKSFVRDLNSLHSALYAVIEEDQRAFISELSDASMKQVLMNSVTDEFLSVLLPFDAFKGGKANYHELCSELIRHENVLDMRRVLRSEHPTDRKGQSGTAAVAHGTGEPKFTSECFNCKKKGHMSRDCPKRTVEERAKLNAKADLRRKKKANSQRNSGSGKPDWKKRLDTLEKTAAVLAKRAGSGTESGDGPPSKKAKANAAKAKKAAAAIDRTVLEDFLEGVGAPFVWRTTTTGFVIFARHCATRVTLTLTNLCSNSTT
jgi:hypothetical protein